MDGAHRLAALKKLKYGMVPCFSIRGNEAVRRLAEIEANLARSPLTRLQIHRHEAEARHLRDVIYGPIKRGGIEETSTLVEKWQNVTVKFCRNRTR